MPNEEIKSYPINPEELLTPEFREFAGRIVDSFDENYDLFLELDNNRQDATDSIIIGIPFTAPRQLDKPQQDFILAQLIDCLRLNGVTELPEITFTPDSIVVSAKKLEIKDANVLTPETKEKIRLEISGKCAYCGENITAEYFGEKPEIITNKKGQFVAEIDLGLVDHACQNDSVNRPIWLALSKKSKKREEVKKWLDSLSNPIIEK